LPETRDERDRASRACRHRAGTAIACDGNHPFGALLADADGKVVLEGENTVLTAQDCTGHAETNLIRGASERFDPEFLSRFTLYTSTESCGMCAGAIYWGNVRRVVFALSQEEIGRITGGNPENMQLTISSREIFARGDHKVQVSGLPSSSGAGARSARRLLGLAGSTCAAASTSPAGAR
jgi:tRNA(Arg) A34 adenosine deaminase TadA